ncbi:MAG: phosphate ABC transporter permease PstA [Halodesulfurarchaeum sp.]
MSGDAPSESFSEVSRVRGRAFSILSRAASWFGIVVLALLLSIVVVDALGLDSATPDWYAGFAAGFGIPLVFFAALVYTRPSPTGWVTGKALAVFVGGLFATGGIRILFVVFEPHYWFFVYTLGVFPGGLAYLELRRREYDRALLAGGLLSILGIGASLPVGARIPVYPVPWMVYFWALVVPIGAVLALVHGRGERRRSGAIFGAVLGGGLIAAFGVPPVSGLTPASALLMYIALAIPYGRYVGIVLERERVAWPGLLAPFVIVGAVASGVLLARQIGTKGPSVWLDWQFLTSAPSTVPEQAGLYPAIVGSVFVIAIVALISFVVGVGAAIYLEEYAPSTGIAGSITRVIRVNISNLAGVPSVVYGLLGLGLFVNLLGMGLGVVIVASLTLTLLILPIVIISAQEAIRSVPQEVRQASFGLGATEWQTIRNVVLPRAIPGILTGTILALSRAIGETAPLLMIGAATTVFSPPETITSQVSAMPLQVFYWSFAAKSAFRKFVAPAGIVTLLAVMLSMNAVAIYLRNRYEQRS